MRQLALKNTIDKIGCSEEIYKEQFTYIFEHYYKRVYNYVYYRVNSHHTAEDLTSQVFEKIMSKINTYSEEKLKFDVWLFAIARNIVNDYFRSLKKNRLFFIDTMKELISKEKNPEEVVVIGERNDKLSKALNTLNINERNIVGLKFGANLKNKEIAKIVEITESNVGVILHRVMKKLKNEIEREEKI